MSRISLDLYRLKEGDPIDQPIIACIANYTLLNKVENPNVLVISMVYGSKEQKLVLVSNAIANLVTLPGAPFVIMVTGITRFEYPPNKYTIEKENENDTREIIPVDDVMKEKIAEARELGFEPIFEDPGAASAICIYTGEGAGYDPLPHSKEVLEYIKNLPEENPEPTHMRVTQEELANMMGGDNSAEEANECSEEREVSE